MSTSRPTAPSSPPPPASPTTERDLDQSHHAQRTTRCLTDRVCQVLSQDATEKVTGRISPRRALWWGNENRLLPPGRTAEQSLLRRFGIRSRLPRGGLQLNPKPQTLTPNPLNPESSSRNPTPGHLAADGVHVRRVCRADRDLDAQLVPDVVRVEHQHSARPRGVPVFGVWACFSCCGKGVEHQRTALCGSRGEAVLGVWARFSSGGEGVLSFVDSKQLVMEDTVCGGEITTVCGDGCTVCARWVASCGPHSTTKEGAGGGAREPQRGTCEKHPPSIGHCHSTGLPYCRSTGLP